MPRFFFNVRHRPGPEGLAVDPEGEELTDVNAARVRALSQARVMIARERLTFIRDWMACSFEIMDEAGQHVLMVPFSDTVRESDSD
ncbi:hypothetical protein SAMN02799636_04299 [Methylobacterium sp. 275MFSha3.1]|uniref:DUF6894 family protein n=1 Tax=Methylobacterium sp. 275MFSha3.1 TaxID=1502746 RepID=UPI0008A75C37|nr:hypothetical protein [Methylobacterium sp. 275MFSha3.1]SEH88902.1 hypothetical protein SAMN02799636_04299 [Methylobacterium sp. 275MFSha3.1]